ncbi:MAG: lysophospholipid acyltransferase family protein, partial [Planctomycetaceae bacterium]
PLVAVVLGLNVRHRERLPKAGPAIVVANHNSHLDTLVLMSLFPLAQLPHLRPVAAEDYFFRNRPLKWFSLNIMGIIPLDRKLRSSGRHPFAPIDEALERGDVVVLFPEGSRGEPERLTNFKSGIAHLAERHPAVPISPVYLHGLGKSLPRGEALLVPFFCDVFAGELLTWTGDRRSFMERLTGRMTELAAEGQFAAWE